MKTTSFIPLIGASLLAGGQLTAQNAQKPNILLILVDDMGWKDTGYTGSDFYETPVIDSLATQSLRFTNAYACAGNSAPSRACMISGQYTPRHGVFAVWSTERGPKDQMKLIPYPNSEGERLPIDNYTLANAMKDAGYATSIAGKWHLGGGKGYKPGERGFDVDNSGESPSKKDFEKSNDPKNMFMEVNQTCEFMEKSVKSGTPFFAYLPYHAVHTAWQARKENIDHFTKKTKGKQHTEVVYAAMIKDMDESIGILTNKLRQLGISDNTMIIFISDNGGVPSTSQAPLRAFKGCFYEGGIRVPMFIHYPGKVKPGSLDVPVQNIDIYPTCIKMAGLEKPQNKILDGKDLSVLFSGKQSTLNRESIFWHFPGYLDKPCPGSRDQVFRQRPSSVIRKGDWKLILYYEEWMLKGGREKIDTNRSVELFNLKDDLSETKDLSNKNKSKRDELLNDLLKWLDDTHAQMPYLR